MAAQEDDRSQTATAELMEAANQIPAIHVNQFLVGSVVSGAVRLSFGEGWEEGRPILYRAAVSMTLEDFRRLKGLIDVVLERHDLAQEALVEAILSGKDKK